jgi:hypothetical protein
MPQKGQRFAYEFLRLPSRALDTYKDDQPDRINFFDDKTENRQDQRPRNYQHHPSEVFKLAEAASRGWNKLHGHELILKVLNNIKFKDGVEVEIKAA